MDPGIASMRYPKDVEILTLDSALTMFAYFSKRAALRLKICIDNASATERRRINI
jgi:hypothetical protein